MDLSSLTNVFATSAQWLGGIFGGRGQDIRAEAAAMRAVVAGKQPPTAATGRFSPLRCAGGRGARTRLPVTGRPLGLKRTNSLKLLPSRIVSRAYGLVNKMTLPTLARPLVYGTWSLAFGVNTSEIPRPLHEYPSLTAFFTRKLRDDARPVDPFAPLVSPVDGAVVSCSHDAAGADKGVLSQVKGIEYHISDFLGITPPTVRPGNALYSAVLYLSPGDYHRFHSPCDWRVDSRAHFAGQLLPVNPLLAKVLPALFCTNERVALMGEWAHGFFSYTAVGATNVGSIRIACDEALRTNRFAHDWQCGFSLADAMGGVPLPKQLASVPRGLAALAPLGGMLINGNNALLQRGVAIGMSALQTGVGIATWATGKRATTASGISNAAGHHHASCVVDDDVDPAAGTHHGHHHHHHHRHHHDRARIRSGSERILLQQQLAQLQQAAPAAATTTPPSPVSPVPSPSRPLPSYIRRQLQALAAAKEQEERAAAAAAAAEAEAAGVVNPAAALTPVAGAGTGTGADALPPIHAPTDAAGGAGAVATPSPLSAAATVSTPFTRAPLADRRSYETPIDLRRGDEVGWFELGSTIVLIFEAPRNLAWTLAPNQKVFMGASIMKALATTTTTADDTAGAAAGKDASGGGAGTGTPSTLTSPSVTALDPPSGPSSRGSSATRTASVASAGTLGTGKAGGAGKLPLARLPSSSSSHHRKAAVGASAMAPATILRGSVGTPSALVLGRSASTGNFSAATMATETLVVSPGGDLTAAFASVGAAAVAASDPTGSGSAFLAAPPRSPPTALAALAAGKAAPTPAASAVATSSPAGTPGGHCECGCGGGLHAHAVRIASRAAAARPRSSSAYAVLKDTLAWGRDSLVAGGHDDQCAAHQQDDGAGVVAAEPASAAAAAAAAAALAAARAAAAATATAAGGFSA